MDEYQAERNKTKQPEVAPWPLEAELDPLLAQGPITEVRKLQKQLLELQQQLQQQAQQAQVADDFVASLDETC